MALTGRITGFAAGLMATPAVAQNQGGYYGHSHMWDGSGWWMFLGPLWMIVVLGVLLKERFAKGEIDKAEFEERRKR